jgi:hypothetical protein
MSDFLDHLANLTGLSDSLFVLLLTLLATIVSLIFGKLAIRKFPFAELVESGEGIGSYCNIIGVLYAVVLGYVLVNVYESYSTADAKVEDEASIVINLLRDAEGLPPLDSLIFRKATLEYVDSVIDVEWPYMLKEKMYHPETFDKFANLFHIAHAVKCDSDEQRLFLAAIIDKLNDLSSTRRERVAVSASRLPDMLWAMIIGVGLVSYSICFIFPIENNRIRLSLICATAATMTFTTLLMFILDRPYNGSLGIQPGSLEMIRTIAKERNADKVFMQDAAGDSATKINAMKEMMKQQIMKKMQEGRNAPPRKD